MNCRLKSIHVIQRGLMPLLLPCTVLFLSSFVSSPSNRYSVCCSSVRPCWVSLTLQSNRPLYLFHLFTVQFLHWYWRKRVRSLFSIVFKWTLLFYISASVLHGCVSCHVIVVLVRENFCLCVHILECFTRSFDSQHTALDLISMCKNYTLFTIHQLHP